MISITDRVEDVKQSGSVRPGDILLGFPEIRNEEFPAHVPVCCGQVTLQGGNHQIIF